MDFLARAVLSFCLWYAVTAPLPALADPPLVVGVLEDVQPGNLSPAMSSVHVRIAFRRDDASWDPMASDFHTLADLDESSVSIQWA
jgi:hypothetical protein